MSRKPNSARRPGRCRKLKEGAAPQGKRLRKANDTALGAKLLVLHDVDAVLKACRKAGVETNEENRRACAGEAAIVKAINRSNDIVEWHVPSLAQDVWFAARALAQAVEKLQNTAGMEVTVNKSGDYFCSNCADGRQCPDCAELQNSGSGKGRGKGA